MPTSLLSSTNLNSDQRLADVLLVPIYAPASAQTMTVPSSGSSPVRQQQTRQQLKAISCRSSGPSSTSYDRLRRARSAAAPQQRGSRTDHAGCTYTHRAPNAGLGTRFVRPPSRISPSARDAAATPSPDLQTIATRKCTFCAVAGTAPSAGTARTNPRPFQFTTLTSPSRFSHARTFMQTTSSGTGNLESSP